MQKLTLSLLCAGVLATIASAEDQCSGVYQAKNYQQAAECYVQQLKSEKSFQNFLRSGISYANQGRVKEALPYFKQAETKAKTQNDYIVLYSWLGTTYSYLGDAKNELFYDMKFLDMSLKSQNREDIGTAYSNLGEYFRRQNQLQKALEYFEKALEYQEESESAVTYGNMAIVYNKLNNLPKAEEIYQKAIEIDEKRGDYASLGHQKSNLGVFYFEQKRYAEAYTTLEEAVTINHKTGNIAQEANALSVIAKMDYEAGQFIKARERAAEALNLAQKSGNFTLIIMANGLWNKVNGK